MTTVFVTNSPTKSCCGKPPGECQCSGQDAPVLANTSAGLPVYNWDQAFRDDAARKPSPNVGGSGQPSMVENAADRPMGGPLGLPRWDW